MIEKTKTLVLGASDNPSRYSYLAIHRLRSQNIPVVAIGKRHMLVADVEVIAEKKEFANIDTITMYLNPVHQPEYYSYILTLKPRRIIFNPGAENAELASIAAQNNIKTINACSLVLLSTGQYL